MSAIELGNHQLKAIAGMKNGCILCGDVGSGKSRTSLAYFYKNNGGNLKNTDIYMKNPKDLYIITTARKRDTLEWEEEMIPFLLSTNKEANYYKNKVIVDSWNNIKKYSEIKDSFFIFDEQRVVGYGAWTKNFLKITKKNEWILLSATPGDTWMDYIPVFIANGFYKNKTEFTSNHVVYSRFSKFPKVDKYVNTRRLSRLRDLILVDMPLERKTKRHYIDIYADYNRSSYKDIFKNRWNYTKDQPIESASELIYELRKIVNSDISRLDKCLDIANERKKSIVFYNFDYELDLLKEIFSQSGFDIGEWNGHKHQDIPNSDKWVYLVQYTAGCEGWNCIKTDTVIFYSQNYSYKVKEQASGRIDRMNTPYVDLYYYDIKSRSGIDVAISKAIKEKKKFNESRFTKLFPKIA